jgi:cobalamin biosynthesis protein CobT
MKKHIRRNKKDQDDLTKKIGKMVKENDDNNNNILKGVNQTLDLLENKIDEVSGIDNEIVFEEKKDYKTFSEKFKVGK